MNAAKGFLHTGLYPFNPVIFPEHLFIPSETTRGINDADDQASGTSCQETTKRNNEVPPQNQESSIQLPNNIPGPSTASTCMASTSKSPVLTVADISPLPKVPTPIKQRQKRKLEAILTSSPNIKELKEKQALKVARETRESARATKRRLDFCPGEAFEEGVFDNNDEDTAACIYCNELYSHSKAKDLWLQCMSCKLWAHLELSLIHI